MNAPDPASAALQQQAAGHAAGVRIQPETFVCSAPQAQHHECIDGEALTREYEALRQRAEADPAARSEALARLARRIDAAGMGRLARRAHSSAASGFAAIGQPARAESELQQCLLLARRDDDRADMHRATYVRATIQRDSGLHDASVRSLLSLLQADALAEMPTSLRYGVIDMLIEACLPVDPIDSVDTCLLLAGRSVTGPNSEQPGFFLASRAGHYLDRYHWGAPAFQTLLCPVRLERRQLDDLMGFALQDTQSARSCTTSTPMVLQALALIDDVLLAHRTQGPQPLVRAWQRLDAADITNPHFLLRAGHQLTSAFLLTGHIDWSVKMLEHFERRIPTRGGSIERRLFWLHLRATVAAASGKTTESLRLYTRYSQEAFAHAGRMNLHVRQVINQAIACTHPDTEPAGARPPQFLRKALDLLEEPRYQGLRIERLADLVGVSSRTLRAAFSRYLGASPKEVSTAKRLDAALVYIQSGVGPGETLAHISAKFGFSNPSRFVTQYKRRHGVTPFT